jgi:hypothetical protein
MSERIGWRGVKEGIVGGLLVLGDLMNGFKRVWFSARIFKGSG